MSDFITKKQHILTFNEFDPANISLALFDEGNPLTWVQLVLQILNVPGPNPTQEISCFMFWFKICTEGKTDGIQTQNLLLTKEDTFTNCYHAPIDVKK